MTAISPSSEATPDLWHHYGRSPAPRALSRMHWDWYQRTGPGAELLGDLTGLVAAELGSGAGHQAAHVTTALAPSRLIALDSSPAQHANSRHLYGDVDGLDFVHADAARYLRERSGTIDVAYSLFGALDFSDPQTLLPALATALRPGGRLVFSTLGHYKGGAPPASECLPAEVPARLPDGSAATVRRWVLDVPVWEKLLAGHGFELSDTDTIRDSGPEGSPSMTTLVIRAGRQR
ncbi:class I SAM-dependent methyltransferase [Streptomyces sp. ITFR-16]|uniref:class I SAM-dependent methyltransferase n=1 Tax=Streptomyces sp. ITFR-16 TaxID=3075198 RepID=UPI00288A3EF1|nr:class I SAM-dependent methyltransferase [Streptomyces sp. ITFR-16]WNI23765.1 class I SAM-dependent methyltransferase [Streptomyces sp. ITFR-16]